MSERRESRRVIQLPVRFQVGAEGPEGRKSFTRDISVMGVFIEDGDVEPGKTVSLAISIGEHEVELVGEVVRRDEGGFAVQFTGTPELARDLLAALVAAAFEPRLVDLGTEK